MRGMRIDVLTKGEEAWGGRTGEPNFAFEIGGQCGGAAGLACAEAGKSGRAFSGRQWSGTSCGGWRGSGTVHDVQRAER